MTPAIYMDFFLFSGLQRLFHYPTFSMTFHKEIQDVNLDLNMYHLKVVINGTLVILPSALGRWMNE